MFQYGIGFNSKTNKALWKKRREVSGFIVDETLIRVGRELVWLWIAIEPIEKVILDICVFLLKGVYLLLNDFFKS
jgi:transposase-like protein